MSGSDATSGGDKPPVLRALIVGCGAVAGGYDEDGPSDGGILTHAGAYRAHPEFDVVACVEPDSARRRAFMDYWAVPHGFATLDDYAQSAVRADVASVCAPTALHESMLMGLLDIGVTAVLCEKPLCADIADSRRVVDAYRDAGVGLLVNYLRRWTPGIVDLKKEIVAGRWGALQNAVGSYNKGILNCGSHMIDLLHFLIGPMTPRAVLRARAGLGPHDPTLDARLDAPGGAPVYLIGSDHRYFFTFELELTFENGRVAFEDLGRAVRVRTLSEDREFPQRRTLQRGAWRETGLGEAMARTVDNLYRHVRAAAPVACDGAAALDAETVCHRLIAMARGDKISGLEIGPGNRA
ncbi:Gfo/Idh/MocA family protein [Varunaivibrio sulfuroxidans]|uniref:Putative dehydrogenase n=1 Tax=Varunaivibrio sulfuroxidans TaxID=1773489 RepID=A0A4R3JCT6_9PROT|nr:Gfo/Idh/MocA family oxidoreductase [Varunaivibrio sulfuroxidans]TCS62996.1 putative dehydrogenase [Varunaivibrio sulfuroxidans]WES31926.1 Gfo/Idh/MocA family oxidoreductase [Varunaivibrio sulfuroxidans]